MRHRLFHKPTRTIRAERYLLEPDAYAVLNAMPFTEAADYFVVIDEGMTHPVSDAERQNDYRRVKVSMELLAKMAPVPVTFAVRDEPDGDVMLVMTRHECVPPEHHCFACRITYHDPDALVCAKCGGNLT